MYRILILVLLCNIVIAPRATSIMLERNVKFCDELLAKENLDSIKAEAENIANRVGKDLIHIGIHFSNEYKDITQALEKDPRPIIKQYKDVAKGLIDTASDYKSKYKTYSAEEKNKISNRITSQTSYVASIHNCLIDILYKDWPTEVKRVFLGSSLKQIHDTYCDGS